MFHTFTCKTYLIEVRFFRNMQSLLIFQSNAFAASVLSFRYYRYFQNTQIFGIQSKKKRFRYSKLRSTLTKCIVSDHTILSHRCISQTYIQENLALSLARCASNCTSHEKKEKNARQCSWVKFEIFQSIRVRVSCQ